MSWLDLRWTNGKAKPGDPWPQTVHGMYPELRWIYPDGDKIAYVVSREDGTFRPITESLEFVDRRMCWYTRYSGGGVSGSLDIAATVLAEDEPWVRQVVAEMNQAKTG